MPGPSANQEPPARPISWRERGLWLSVLVVLGIAALSYQQEARRQLNMRLENDLRLIEAQQTVIKMQREAVQAATRSVEIAAQGRLDCAQSLEVLTQRQEWRNSKLGLSRLTEVK